MKAYKQTEARIAWMRANVRCETCKHRRRFRQGFVEDKPDALWACGNEYSPWYMSPAGGDESCATHWEPLEARDGK